MSKIAIIGASTGQYPLVQKAKDLGIETFVFAWEKGNVCKDIADHYYPISIFEKDEIAEICNDQNIEGVISNASDTTAVIVSYIAEKLGLNATSYKNILSLRDKYHVRNITKDILGLSQPRYIKYQGVNPNIYPCVVKPTEGGAKKGVSCAFNAKDFKEAILYATEENNHIIIEEFINGQELSVESISFHGRHFILQITEKESSSAPHFVELAHHLPASLPQGIEAKIRDIIPQILNAVGFTDGACHTEIKYDDNNIYLIEINPRGGGDEISNRLVSLSSGTDYLRCMIDVALNCFNEQIIKHEGNYSGIYFLCKQTSALMPLFKDADNQSWLVEKQIYSNILEESHSNYERNGYLIYKSDHKITSKDINS
jgi:carbamoylphosphate synthase large subunit